MLSLLHTHTPAHSPWHTPSCTLQIISTGLALATLEAERDQQVLSHERGGLTFTLLHVLEAAP